MAQSLVEFCIFVCLHTPHLCHAQTLMNVPGKHISVIGMPCVWTLMEPIPVHAFQGFKEMGFHAIVSLM